MTNQQDPDVLDQFLQSLTEDEQKQIAASIKTGNIPATKDVVYRIVDAKNMRKEFDEFFKQFALKPVKLLNQLNRIRDAVMPQESQES